jgi:hypothetical protein
MAISNEVVRGGDRNRGAVSAGGDKILAPPFSPACGSSRHLHGQSHSCGVDRFWLTGARDEGGSGDTLDSEVSSGPVWRML